MPLLSLVAKTQASHGGPQPGGCLAVLYQSNPGTSPGFSMGIGNIKPRRCRGFTIIELIVVIIVAGILAAFAVPKWSGGTGFEERGYRDQVAATLRYAQKSAIAARRTVCANFTTTPSVLSVQISTAQGAVNCALGGPLLGPDDQNLILAATPPAAIAAAPASVIFDAAGRPNAAASISFAGLPGTLDVIVEAETGYVH
jgi:MSHA pilin protein MshC